MKTFKKIERRPLSERVASEIEESIITGNFSVGSQLPSEQRLADQFGVSRNVVREAFKVLRERGLIEIQNGSGAYVRRPDSGITSDALGRYIRLMGADTSIEALYETRRILEGATARLAAQRADAADLDVLETCLNRMREHAGSVERWSEADLEFHLAVARATHNPFLILLLQPLVDQVRSVIVEGYAVPGATERGLAAHTKIWEAIKSRDADSAYEAIMDHLRDSEGRIQQEKGLKEKGVLS